MKTVQSLGNSGAAVGFTPKFCKEKYRLSRKDREKGDGIFLRLFLKDQSRLGAEPLLFGVPVREGFRYVLFDPDGTKRVKTSFFSRTTKALPSKESVLISAVLRSTLSSGQALIPQGVLLSGDGTVISSREDFCRLLENLLAFAAAVNRRSPVRLFLRHRFRRAVLSLQVEAGETGERFFTGLEPFPEKGRNSSSLAKRRFWKLISHCEKSAVELNLFRKEETLHLNLHFFSLGNEAYFLEAEKEKSFFSEKSGRILIDS